MLIKIMYSVQVMYFVIVIDMVKNIFIVKRACRIS